MASRIGEGSLSSPGAGVSSIANGVKIMNSPHLRPSRSRHAIYDSEIPAAQTRALHRRQALEAHQRAFRDIETGRPATSPADLTPVRRRMDDSRPPG
jgi:hypothetical protein